MVDEWFLDPFCCTRKITVGGLSSSAGTITWRWISTANELRRDRIIAPRKAENHAATKGTRGNLVESITGCATKGNAGWSSGASRFKKFVYSLFLPLSRNNFVIVNRGETSSRHYRSLFHFIDQLELYDLIARVSISWGNDYAIEIRYVRRKLDVRDLVLSLSEPRRVTDGLPLPAYARGLILDIEPERRKDAPPKRDARTLTHWLATPHTLLPFQCVLARNRASGEMRSAEEAASVRPRRFVALVFPIDGQKSRYSAYHPSSVTPISLKRRKELSRRRICSYICIYIDRDGEKLFPATRPNSQRVANTSSRNKGNIIPTNESNWTIIVPPVPYVKMSIP